MRKKYAGLTAWIGVAISGAVLCPLHLLAQTSEADNGTTLRVSTQFVLLDASVERKKPGEAIGDLHVEDFLLEEDGIVQRLTYLSQNRLLLSVGFWRDRHIWGCQFHRQKSSDCRRAAL